MHSSSLGFGKLKMEMEVEKKKRSFSYEIGDQKLKLIDISSEEDCLIDSPLFDSLEDLRLSGH